jgi:hypothetical protein
VTRSGLWRMDEKNVRKRDGGGSRKNARTVKIG